LLDNELHEGTFGIGGPDHKDLFELTARLSHTAGLKPQEAGLFAEYLYQGAKKMTRDTFESMMTDGHLDQSNFFEKLTAFKQEAMSDNSLPAGKSWAPRVVHYDGKNYLGLVRKISEVSDKAYEMKISTSGSLLTTGEQMQDYIDQADSHMPPPPTPKLEVNI